MSVVFLVIALIALSYVLSRSVDVLVTGIKQLAEGTAFQEYGLTTFLVALATSLPELFVGVTAALEGNSELPLGVALGSNIANVSLVMGGAAVISGAVVARKQIYRKDIFYALLIGVLPLMLMLDRALTRGEGVVLLAVYALFVLSTMNKKKRRRLEEQGEQFYEDDSWTHKLLMVVGRKDVELGMLRLVIGSALLIVCSDLIVRLSGMIAEILSIPVLIVGLFMVSVGTSLPELTFQIQSVAKKEYMMAFGNIIGSTVANSALILGVVSILQPIDLGNDGLSYFVSSVTFVVMFLMFWVFSYSKKKLDRWEGGVLVLAYLGFLATQLVLLGSF